MNDLIIENFKKLVNIITAENAKLLGKTDAKQIMMNNFRIKSLKKVISIISKLTFEITNKNIDQLNVIAGVGKGSIQRIQEILSTKTLAELANYDKIIKKGEKRELIINDLMNIVGIGRVMANSLIDTYKIKSANDLKILVEKFDKANKTPSNKTPSNKTHSLPSLPLINDKIRLGLKYLGKFEGSIPRKEIDIIYDYLQDVTDKFNKNMFITICGSYRRELPTSSDIDILLVHMNLITMDDIINYNLNYNLTNTSTDTITNTSTNTPNLLSSYVNHLHKIKFLIDDITDKNIKTKYMGFGQHVNNKIRRIDIRLIPMVSYWPALLYFTGSYELNQNMRLKAKKMGYKLNEYGLYDLKTNDMIVVTSEQEIFEKLEMNYLLPNQR